MSNDRLQLIRQCLETKFTPSELLVKDQSHLHVGHAGASDGRGHFEVVIIAEEFAEKSRLERHRMVYAALGKLIESDIHAIRVKASAPSER